MSDDEFDDEFDDDVLMSALDVVSTKTESDVLRNVKNCQKRKLIKNETHEDDKEKDEFEDEFDDDVLTSAIIENVENVESKKRKSSTPNSTVLHKKRKSTTTTKSQLQHVLTQYYGYVYFSLIHARTSRIHSTKSSPTDTQIFEKVNPKRSKLS